MDPFPEIFRVVADVLEPSGIDCLLIGGLAVNHYGYSRSTLDVDFMIVSDDRDEVRNAMRNAGFTNMSTQPNVMFFQRPETTLRIDFLNTDKSTMSKMLGHAVRAEFCGRNVRVPSLLDLLAMKFFALSQASGRRADKDIPDIAWLSLINGLDVEIDLHPLSLRFANEDIFHRVSAKIKELQV